MTRPQNTAARPPRGRPDPQRVLAISAALVTVLLTAAGFWLSYEHLHDLATAHGLANAAARAWTWPATIDMFVIVGELLVLRSALAGRVDWFAVALTATGSGGSIALNVAAVGTDLPHLDYIVAAIPPTAALLAFGALMRQIHGYLAHRVPAAVPAVPAPQDTGYTEPQAYPQPTSNAAPTTVPQQPAPVELPPVPATAPQVYPHPDQYEWATSHTGVPAALLGVPAARTRVHDHTDHVPDDQPIEPDPDPDPNAGTPDEDLAEQLREAYPGYQGSGRTMSIRAIRTEVGVGQARAQRIQQLLTGERVG